MKNLAKKFETATTGAQPSRLMSGTRLRAVNDSVEEVDSTWMDEASTIPRAHVVPLPEHERRLVSRVPVAIEVTLTSDSHFYVGLTGDISQGGIFFCTYEPRELGMAVAIELNLDGQIIETTGKVRWIREASEGAPPGFGISFDELSPEHATLIDTFCRARAAVYYEVDG